MHTITLYESDGSVASILEIPSPATTPIYDAIGLASDIWVWAAEWADACGLVATYNRNRDGHTCTCMARGTTRLTESGYAVVMPECSSPEHAR